LKKCGRKEKGGARSKKLFPGEAPKADLKPCRRWLGETSLERAGKRQTVYNMIHHIHTLKVESLINQAEERDIDRLELKDILADLKQKGLVYTPKPGFVGCVDD